MVRSIKIFNDRYPLIGPTFWILSLQYFITQFVVAQAWTHPYSLAQNTISDLGNTACGNYGGQFVCSPQSAWMNASFVVLGLTMLAGSTLIYHEFQRSLRSAIGFGAMAMAGFGTVMVGLFPENTIGALHFLGAMMPFLIGNVGMVVLGVVLDLPKSLRLYTILSGGIPLIALALFVTHNYLGLGVGGMERITAYPQTFWLIVFGVYMSHSHWRSRTAVQPRKSTIV